MSTPSPQTPAPSPAAQTEMTIGAFSRLSRLSLKALRLYDALGLLPPARVDAASGYRYYHATQLDTARLIGLLRQLDLTLDQIQAVLDLPSPDRADRLSDLWQTIDAHHTRRRALAAYVLSVLDPARALDPFLEDAPMTDPATPTHTPAFPWTVQERFVPEQRFATLTRRVYVSDLSDAIREGLGRLHALTGAQASGPSVVIYHGEVNTDNDGPIELCVPYAGEVPGTGLAGELDGVTLRVEPAHWEAYVALTKREFEFPYILRAYDATAAHAQRHGSLSPLACREVYHADWDGSGPGDVVGDVAWPFVREAGEALS